MTPERVEEMRQYRQQAQIAETRLRARAKQKLLTRVQLIMAEIDVSQLPFIDDKLSFIALCVHGTVEQMSGHVIGPVVISYRCAVK